VPFEFRQGIAGDERGLESTERRDTKMMSQTVQDAINRQINAEMSASYSYLAMSAWCARSNFTGSARWLRIQSQEEHGHAMKLLDFMLARNARPDLMKLEQPRSDYKSLSEIFETAYEQEQAVSAQIDALYELVFREKTYPAVVQLEWFLNEQVEEEKTCREIVAKLRMVGSDPAGLLEIDNSLGSRAAGAAGQKDGAA
jgi:ferritin